MSTSYAISGTRRGRKRKSSATASRTAALIAQPSVPLESAGLPVDRLVWMGNYLRIKQETSDTWTLNEMGWLVESTVSALTDTINEVFDRFFRSVTTHVATVTVTRSPVLIIDMIRSTTTTGSTAIDLTCRYENTITGVRSDVDEALHMLLQAASRLYEQKNVKQQLTLLNYWNTPVLQINHPITDVPPEMFDYLFNCATSGHSCLGPDAVTRMSLSVQKCSVTYNHPADGSDSSTVLTIALRLDLLGKSVEIPFHSFLPLNVVLQCSCNG